MPIEIRPARPDELDRVHFVVAYSFSGDRTEAGRERLRHIEEMAPPVVLLEDGEIIASLRVYPFRMSVNGTMVPLGGVSSVACLPEYRRKGYVGELLRWALADMRERGVPLSALYTPHPNLYRRYGWMVAAANLKYSFHPKHVSAYNAAPVRGRAVRVTEEDWPAVAELYGRHSAGRTGQLERDERWWKECFFRPIYDFDRKLSDVALWRGDGGGFTGYISYHASRTHGPAGKSSLWVREFVALDGNAYTGLLRYLLSHDLTDEIWWHGPIEDPIAYALDDSYQVKREFVDDLMLRVVDIESAVAARPPGAGAPEGALSVSITDAAAPWNHGAWRIECSGDRLSAKRIDGPGDLAMEAATFAALYDGYMRASEAVRSGLAEASDHSAALLADRFFVSDYPPNGSDFF